jgi:GDPmannose 4,6-dehydratase
VVEIDPRYFRPTEVDLLIGDASKAKRLLGWEAKTTLHQMVREMMAADMSLVKREADYRRVDEETIRSKKQP